MQTAATTTKLVDAELVRQVQAGDAHAYAELVRKYQDRVYNASWRVCGHVEDARDITQEAFLKAFESIGRFQGHSAFYTWVFRIAINLALSARRRNARRPMRSLDEATDRAGTGQAAGLAAMVRDERAEDPAGQAAAAETRQELARALAQLEPDYRAAVVLRDVEGLDYQEIAEVLEVAVGTVKSRIHRGRMALRRLLDDTGGSE